MRNEVPDTVCFAVAFITVQIEAASGQEKVFLDLELGEERRVVAVASCLRYDRMLDAVAPCHEENGWHAAICSVQCEMLAVHRDDFDRSMKLDRNHE